MRSIPILWLVFGLLISWGNLLGQDQDEDSLLDPEIGVERPDDLDEEGDKLFPLPEQYVDDYFSEDLESLLVDPQNLLKRREKTALSNFLGYHADDSEIDIHVLLFRKDQEIPGDIRIEELAERAFGEGKTSVLVLYFLGEPSRSAILFSSHLSDVVNRTEQKRILQRSVAAAEKSALASDQLQEFCERTAIQVSQIEQSTDLNTEPALSGVDGEMVDPGESGGHSLQNTIRDLWNEWGVPAVVIAGGLIIGLIARFIIRSRARYVFPPYQGSPRLGGKHAAGIGAVIRFETENESPSVQHSASDDSLGGI